MMMGRQHFKNYTSVSSGLNEDDVYTQELLKQELEKHYGSRVTITTVTITTSECCYSNIKCKIHNSRGT